MTSLSSQSDDVIKHISICAHSQFLTNFGETRYVGHDIFRVKAAKSAIFKTYFLWGDWLGNRAE